MSLTTLQITLDKKLKEEVTKLAKEDGFDNLPALARYLFTNYKNRKLVPMVSDNRGSYRSNSDAEKPINYEKTKRRLDKAYAQFLKDEKAGKIKSFHTIEEIRKFHESI